MIPSQLLNWRKFFGINKLAVFAVLLIPHCLLSRPIRPACCKPCDYSGTLSGQWWRPCNGHACWSSHRNGPGLPLLGVLGFPLESQSQGDSKSFLCSVCNNLSLSLCKALLSSLYIFNKWSNTSASDTLELQLTKSYPSQRCTIIRLWLL